MPIGRVYLSCRGEARKTSPASLKGPTNDPKPNRFFHSCRQHCGAGDIACQRAISRSCPTRAGAVGTDDGATATYRAATDVHLSEAPRRIGLELERAYRI